MSRGHPLMSEGAQASMRPQPCSRKLELLPRTTAAGWFLNHTDILCRPDPWAQYVKYTRSRPPAGFWRSLDEVAGLAPEVYRRWMAVHEAGHAVLQLEHGLGIEYVELRQGGTAGNTQLGHTHPRPLTDAGAEYAAGERAMVRWLHETGRWTEEREWVAEMAAVGDRRDFAELTVELCNVDITFTGCRASWADYAAFKDHADQQLELLWDRVLTLAQHLDERGHLDGTQATRIAGYGDRDLCACPSPVGEGALGAPVLSVPADSLRKWLFP